MLQVTHPPTKGDQTAATNQLGGCIEPCGKPGQNQSGSYDKSELFGEKMLKMRKKRRFCAHAMNLGKQWRVVYKSQETMTWYFAEKPEFIKAEKYQFALCTYPKH